MNQITQGIITKQGIVAKPYENLDNDRTISFSFPLKGYGKITSLSSLIKKIYKKSFLHDFQNVLTAKVD